MGDEDEPFETEFGTYRDRIEKPLVRLFGTYGRNEWRWLVIGLVTSVFTYGALLVTIIVLGTTIDAVFTGESAYALPLVPDAWLPTDQTDQFWLSAGRGVRRAGLPRECQRAVLLGWPNNRWV